METRVIQGSIVFINESEKISPYIIVSNNYINNNSNVFIGVRLSTMRFNHDKKMHLKFEANKSNLKFDTNILFENIRSIRLEDIIHIQKNNIEHDFLIEIYAVWNSIVFPANNIKYNNLEKIIDDFRQLLFKNTYSDERIFHDFLYKNSILLDVYGDVYSKPKFEYPPNASPLGKKYIEPDFIIQYPDKSYMLVELERASKKVSTIQGQPRSEFTQASFQIAEWKTYIAENYNLVKDRYPGISVNCRSMLIISRNFDENFGRWYSIEECKKHLKMQYRVDYIYTYDDILNRANDAFLNLKKVGIF